MKFICIIFILLCSQLLIQAQDSNVNPVGAAINSRFSVPSGFKRIEITDASFGAYLRNLPLKDHNSPVKYYNGSTKPNNGVYVAVVKMDIGRKNLVQCADAVMKLRADYLYGAKQYEKIHFNLTNGFRMDYSKWREGYRLRVNGNKTTWVKTNASDSSYKSFLQYMDVVFMYAGTQSLSKELKKINYSDVKPGDVLIKGGFPGHAVIVLDMAINAATREKIFLLAQSYMPAQEIQVLANPVNSKLSPWYVLNPIDKTIITPEWVFSSIEAMRFAE